MSDHSTARGGKYLTFILAGEHYGIGILDVKEIIGLQAITTVPQTPDHVRGVINLRGKVIPVTDLRRRFALPEADVTDRSCIIVVDVKADDRQFLTGLLVDEVSEVLNIKDDQIEDAPLFGTTVDTDYVHGMAKTDDTVKILLDITRVLTSVESIHAAA